MSLLPKSPDPPSHQVMLSLEEAYTPHVVHVEARDHVRILLGWLSIYLLGQGLSLNLVLIDWLNYMAHKL